MTSKIKSMLSRLAATFLKPTLAILAACIVGGVWGDWLYWDNGGSNNIFTTPENWSTDVFPGTSDTTAFEGDAVGKTIVFNDQGTKVKEVFIRNNWWSKDELSPVVFTATDPAYGFDSQGVFSCGDFGGTVNGCRSALTIQSGTYTAAALSYWGWCANAGFDLAIEGGSSLTLNAGLNMMYGGYSDDNTPWSNIGNVTNSINIKSGTLTVNGGDVLIGTDSINSKTTINVGEPNGNGSAEAVFSVGSATSHNLKLSEWNCTGTTIEINVNKGGSLKAYNIVNGGGTGNPALNINFNGGTLQALGVGDTALIGSDLAVTVSAAGGTIDTNGKEVTIASAITGGGTLYVKGGGKVTFTATPTCTVLVEGDTTAVDGSENAIGTVQNTWIGASGDYWNDSTKWSAGSVPTSSQLVKIDTDGTIKISGWFQTDADVCKAGAVIIDANVTFNGPWKRLWVYGIAGRDAISGSGILTLSDNTGLENGSASSVLEISSGLTFDGNADHAWLGGDVTGSSYGWRVKGATTINCTIQTDKPAEFAGALTIGANGVINTMGNAVTVTATSVSGSGLTFTGSGAVAIPLSGSTLTVPAITTADNLNITGYGDILASGSINVTGTLTATPNAANEATLTAHPDYTIKITADSVSVGTLNGAAMIETDKGTTVGTGIFYGCVKGGILAQDDFVSQGRGFDGKVSVAGGKIITIGNRLAAMSNIRFHLDATDSNSYALENETSNLAKIKGGDQEYPLESGTTAAVLINGDENHFGGKPYFQFNGSHYARGSKVSARSYIAVTHPDSLSGYLAWNSDQDRLGISGANWFARCFGKSIDVWLTQKGTTDRSATVGQDTIISLVTRITASNNREDHIGKDYNGAIAEFVGFNSEISVEDRIACEMYLMNKWGLNAANIRPFSATAEVEFGAGSTLDLGGYTQTLASISMIGTGKATVRNGSLTLTNEISLDNGQTLVLPAGTAYTCADGLINVAVDSETGVITLSKGAASVGDTFYATVQEAIDALVSGAVSGTLKVYQSATVDLSSNVVEIDVELTDGVTLQFAPNLPWQGSCNEGKIKNQRVASTYVWTPGESSSEWGTRSNWRIGEAIPAELPDENDTVEFPSVGAPWTVMMTSEQTVAGIVANGNMSIAGAQVATPSVSGTGTITLGNNAGFVVRTADLTISADLAIIADKATPAVFSRPVQKDIKITSKVSGSGALKSEVGKNVNFTKLELSGDWSDFKGTFEVPANNISRNGLLINPGSVSSNAAYTVTSSRGTGNAIFNAGGTYRFGSLSGYLEHNNQSVQNIVIEVGHLGLEDTLGGSYFPENNTFGRINSNYCPSFRKVGDGTLTFTGRDLRAIEIKGGVLYVTTYRVLHTYWDDKNKVIESSEGASGSHDTTLSFAGGTLKLAADVLDDISGQIVESAAAIVFDDGNVNRTWASALASSNVGGFTKKGAGTLTLSQPPAYTGTTTVEAGALVMPASAEASLTLGANTIVSARDANTITLANATTVNVTGLAHDHATATVTAGGESVTVNEGVAVVPVGSDVIITWAAESGYQITANGTQNIDNIREAVAATPPTVSELPTVSIAAPVVGAYGNDFDTVSVTAGVTSTYPAETTITYTLKANGTAIATTTAAGDATSVTFGNANVSGLTRYGNISYTVEASGANVTAATSDATTAMLADAEGWIDEKKSTTGTTGSWKTADGAAATVTYDNETERAELSDNKFSATNCSTGDVVTVTIKDVIYTALSDTSTVDGDAQGSIALGGTESEPKFMVLTKSGNVVQWSEAAGVNLNPALNTSYTIVFTFNYTNNTYSITVNGAALTVGGSATYDIVKTTNKYVKDIDFLGAGSIKAIEGIRYDAMMAVDQDGVRYATVADALNANKGVKGAIIKLLHGTSNTSVAGWSYNADTMTFIKKAVGLIFLAF